MNTTEFDIKQAFKVHAQRAIIMELFEAVREKEAPKTPRRNHKAGCPNGTGFYSPKDPCEFCAD